MDGDLILLLIGVAFCLPIGWMVESNRRARRREWERWRAEQREWDRQRKEAYRRKPD